MEAFIFWGSRRVEICCLYTERGAFPVSDAGGLLVTARSSECRPGLLGHAVTRQWLHSKSTGDSLRLNLQAWRWRPQEIIRLFFLTTANTIIQCCFCFFLGFNQALLQYAMAIRRTCASPSVETGSEALWKTTLMTGVQL